MHRLQELVRLHRMGQGGRAASATARTSSTSTAARFGTLPPPLTVASGNWRTVLAVPPTTCVWLASPSVSLCTCGMPAVTAAIDCRTDQASVSESERTRSGALHRGWSGTATRSQETGCSHSERAARVADVAVVHRAHDPQLAAAVLEEAHGCEGHVRVDREATALGSKPGSDQTHQVAAAGGAR